MTVEEAANRYIGFCEAMTPRGLDRLAEFCAPDIHFRDPFNESADLVGYRRILEKMFADVGQPEFIVTGRALAGRTCFLRWRFTFCRRGGQEVTIQGMSELNFTAEGLVERHFDFWDAGQVYEMVPLLRGLIRLVRRRLSVPADGKS